jgi:hypothetical protein
MQTTTINTIYICSREISCKLQKKHLTANVERVMTNQKTLSNMRNLDVIIPLLKKILHHI